MGGESAARTIHERSGKIAHGPHLKQAHLRSVKFLIPLRHICQSSESYYNILFRYRLNYDLCLFGHYAYRRIYLKADHQIPNLIVQFLLHERKIGSEP